MQLICDHEGCNNGPMTTGHALYRVSPKGQGMPFVGLCSEHMAPDNMDPVTRIFEDTNKPLGEAK